MIQIDIEPPKNCNTCPINNGIRCNITWKEYNWGLTDRPSWCPIKEQTDIKEWLESFDTESATKCFTAVQELKKRVDK